jgi:hypothetical protein
MASALKAKSPKNRNTHRREREEERMATERLPPSPPTLGVLALPLS